jgi:hypothetical protein
MLKKNGYGALIVLGIALLAVSAMALFVVQPAQAQCGSQASSCKNCHETQGKDPVNNDGTGWHQSHAFGDFCYICHGGNNQATDETAAHAGMVAPMSDIQAACAQCHPNDLQARADVYAAKLGVTASLGAQPPAQSSAPAAPTELAASEPAAAEPAAPAPQAAAVSSADIVDYVARYNQEALHREPTNWGNVILVGILVVLVFGGLYLVNRHEGWVSVSFTEKKPLGKEYPEDVAHIADQVEKLGATARKSLSQLLTKPAAAADLLAAIQRLSTDSTSGEDHPTDAHVS